MFGLGPTELIIILGFGVSIVFGIWARRVASRKERSPIGWFLLGFFFLALGVVAAYLVPVKHH